MSLATSVLSPLHHSRARAWIAILASTLVYALPLAAEEKRSGEVLFYRMLDAERNAPLYPRTRTVCIIDGTPKTSSTGMATSGYTEYPFRQGRISYTFAETYAFFPRFVLGAAVESGVINAGDVLIDHVYAPDACVWGATGREFVQTFSATGRELVSFTLLVATRPGRFFAEVRAGGPSGKRVGSVRRFRGGYSTEWGWCRWRAGDVPLVPGATYAIALRREDGEPWRPYLHATGDAYARGELFVDGRRVAGSDLGAWIVEEPPEVTRALVLDADEEGWVHGAAGVSFVSRAPSVRLIDAKLSPAPEKCRDVVARVWSTDPVPRLLAGPKWNVACTTPGTTRRAQFLFGSGELDVETGGEYRLEVFTIPHKGSIPAPSETEVQRHDVRAWIYGEIPDAAGPAIYNLRASYEKKSDLRLRWGTTAPATVAVELTRLSPREVRTAELPIGESEIVFDDLWRGHDHDLRLVARSAGGAEWRTPVYRLRPPGGPHPPPPPPLYPDHPAILLPLAPPVPAQPSHRNVIRFARTVPIENAGFEDGLEGWMTSGPDAIASLVEQGEGAERISQWEGKKMAGWSIAAGKKREQVFAESSLFRRIPTESGHVYLVSVRAHTSVRNGPRGDTRVRLWADPRAGEENGDANGTQWYWTDGRWLRFEHTFRAAGDEATIGVDFFRWRDLDRASAFVDNVRVFDLGASERSPSAGTTLVGQRTGRALALAHERADASDRVEASLSAPPGFVITGIGARAARDNVTTLRLRVAPVSSDGTLGESEFLVGGWETDAGLEAAIDLPDGFVATGFGARIAPEWDVKTLAVWGRPLSADGTLGEEKEFRAGVEPRGGLERKVRLPHGRVLSAIGLRCHLNDVAGISARSREVVPTATGRQSGSTPSVR